MYPDSWDNEIRPILHKEDIAFLLENTDFDEYDIREWFREFLKVLKTVDNVANNRGPRLGSKFTLYLSISALDPRLVATLSSESKQKYNFSMFQFSGLSRG